MYIKQNKIITKIIIVSVFIMNIYNIFINTVFAIFDQLLKEICNEIGYPYVPILHKIILRLDKNMNSKSVKQVFL